MKKLLPKILIIMLVVLLALAMAACHKKSNDTPEAPNEYETATYNVTFVTNGLSDFSQFNLVGVDFGTYISAPKYSDGSPAIPVKVGYTFSYWSSDGATVFDFENTPVTSDLTLTAVYLPKTFVHTVDLTARLVQGVDAQGKTTYDIESGYYTNGTLGEDEILESIYNDTSTDLPIPTTTLPGDRFLFWYYIGEDGKPVEFSTTAPITAESTTRVSELKSYTFTSGLTLYPMWYSMIAKITVVYKDSLSDAEYGNFEYSQKDFAVEAQSPDMRSAKTGYAFEKWYFVTEDEDGNEVKHDFVFDDIDDPEDNPTDLTAAAGIESTFESGTLYLYASWKKIISVASKQDFEAIYNVLHGDSTEEEKQTILNAAIYFAGTIDLGTTEFEPLFEQEHKFAGLIDGGLRDANGDVQSNAKIVGGVFGDSVSASVLGYIAGEVQYIDFENVTLKFAVPETDGTTFVAGIVATVNSGTIDSVNVTEDALSIDIAGSGEAGGYLTNGLASVTFGGIVGSNSGEIKNASATVSVSALSESLVLGGVAGKNTATIKDASATLTLTAVKCLDNNKGADGLSYAQIGGVVGSNSGTIEGVTAIVNGTSVTSERLDFGGVAASNLGVVSKTTAAVTLTANSKTYANVGGLAGKSDGEVKNCLADATLTVNYTGSGNVIAGGLVGNNGSTNVGNLSYSYALGTLTIESANSASVYAGGVVGKNTNRSKITNYFAAVDLTVQNAGTNNVGALFGDDNNVTSISAGWYANDITVSVNGSAAQELGIGEAVARENLKSAEFVIGASSTIKFDTAIWKIEGDNFPVLK